MEDKELYVKILGPILLAFSRIVDFENPQWVRFWNFHLGGKPFGLREEPILTDH